MENSVEPRLIEKYGERSFMYTEYPNLRFWSKEIGDLEYRKTLLKFDKSTPVQLYVHIPHCHTQCDFCTCHTVITLDYSVVRRYLDFLLREIEMLYNVLGKLNVREIHLGGGSPTYLKESDFDELVARLSLFTDIKSLDEFSIEIDPRRVKQDKVRYYHEKGINRISFGIQDFDTDVQKAINRVQPIGLIERMLTPDIRSLFPNGINFDILCGLPRQTKDGMRKTIEKVAELSPDRVCLNFMHFGSEFSPHQQKMVKFGIPNNMERKELFTEALEVFERSDYVRAGYDHFVKPTDAIAVALKEGKMKWNRLGVTAGRYSSVLALGVHGSTNVEGVYFQNFYDNEPYEAAITKDKFPIFRGHIPSEDDLLRRTAIHSLRNYFEARVDVEYFAKELKILGEFRDDGVIELNENHIVVTTIGRQFTDRICEVFDTYKTRA